MSRCITIDTEMLEKTKLDKVLPRLLKRGDDQGKVLAKKVIDNAARLSQTKTSGGKAGQQPQVNGEIHKSSTDKKEIKREPSEDGSKKGSNMTSKASTVGKVLKSASGSDTRQSPAKTTVKSSTKPGETDSSAPKTKTNHITTKPTGFFAGLKSASKKPGTSARPDEGKKTR